MYPMRHCSQAIGNPAAVWCKPAAPPTSFRIAAPALIQRTTAPGDFVRRHLSSVHGCDDGVRRWPELARLAARWKSPAARLRDFRIEDPAPASERLAQSDHYFALMPRWLEARLFAGSRNRLGRRKGFLPTSLSLAVEFLAATAASGSGLWFPSLEVRKGCCWKYPKLTYRIPLVFSRHGCAAGIWAYWNRSAFAEFTCAADFPDGPRAKLRPKHAGYGPQCKSPACVTSPLGAAIHACSAQLATHRFVRICLEKRVPLAHWRQSSPRSDLIGQNLPACRALLGHPDEGVRSQQNPATFGLRSASTSHDESNCLYQFLVSGLPRG